ncbi:hypothetical protein [Rossellomorea aquimaris]|uniref:Uncharacterized protein n=1 Tax=Rossellomorea aquimaris TaxID=189382 RepID=A0A5D4TPT3_9BACI|nr:hypothetical protein [Rossellomorea aquimaris]TYS76264.1 hypothetical protein FZC80_15105 [Rossellomorea aquimaris]
MPDSSFIEIEKEIKFKTVSETGNLKNKSGSASISSDRQMFQREKKAGFPFILFGLFDPEELGAEAGRNKSGSASISSDRQMFQREKRRSFLLFSLGYLTQKG